MDYPAPRVKITDDGKLDLSDAYGVGIDPGTKSPSSLLTNSFLKMNRSS